MICGLGVLALAVAALSLATLSGHATPATVDAAGITLGVDVTTDGNTASTLGTIDNCKRVEVGNDFDIDVYVTDVTGLQGWDAFFAFDGKLLTLTGQQEMMISGVSASDPVPDSGPYNHYLGYGSATSKVDGSGVLVRLTFHATAPGVSTASISYNPLGPQLNPGTDPIGGTYFNGPVFAASIAIGQDCPASPPATDTPGPTVTAPPTPSRTPSPTPSATPSPTPGQPIVGDADCSGHIALPDVLLALTYASHLGPGNECQGRTDVDCDGFVTANDVLPILRYLTGYALPAPTNCAQVGSPVFG